MVIELKLNEETKQPTLTEDGKIQCLDDGKELNLDIVSMYQKITDLGLENKTRRETANELKEKFSIFTEIEDLADYKKKADTAIKAQQDWKDEDWMKASKVNELKKQMSDSFEEKIKAKDIAIGEIEVSHVEKLSGKDAQIRNLLVSSKFTGSKFFNGENPKTLLTPDIAEAYFGKNFKVEIVGDKTVLRAYYDGDGKNAVLSKQNPGEPAPFEEAIEFIIDKYPNKDNILRTSKGGSGGTGGSGGDHEEKDDVSELNKKWQKAKEEKNVGEMVRLKGLIVIAQSKT